MEMTIKLSPTDLRVLVQNRLVTEGYKLQKDVFIEVWDADDTADDTPLITLEPEDYIVVRCKV